MQILRKVGLIRSVGEMRARRTLVRLSDPVLKSSFGEGLSNYALPPVSMQVSCVNFPFFCFLLGSDFLHQ